MAIVQGELRAGQQINQQEWADKLEVSRAVLREGLKVLSTERSLLHDHHRGYFVAEYSAPDVDQLYWLRIAVERELFLTMRLPDPSESEHLTHWHEESVTSLAAGEVYECIEADRRFFFLVYDLSRLRFLGNEAKRLWDLAAMYRADHTTQSSALAPEQFRQRRRLQLKAVLCGDRQRFAESVIDERHRMIEFYLGSSSAPWR